MSCTGSPDWAGNEVRKISWRRITSFTLASRLPGLEALAYSVMWAQGFLDYWCCRAVRSRLEPMKKVARMLRAHEELILNWFRAKGEISTGAVEGLNNKSRVVTRRHYGFRAYEAMEIALYHTLGKLPEPEATHRYC
jgi:transposase